LKLKGSPRAMKRDRGYQKLRKWGVIENQLQDQLGGGHAVGKEGHRVHQVKNGRSFSNKVGNREKTARGGHPITGRVLGEGEKVRQKQRRVGPKNGEIAYTLPEAKKYEQVC